MKQETITGKKRKFEPDLGLIIFKMMQKPPVNILAFCSLMLVTSCAFGQKTRTLNDVLQTGLKNNFDIRIERNVAQINANNNTFGNAGFYPTLEADGSAVGSVDNIHQKYSSGTEFQQNNVGGSNIQAGIELDWTVFNGFLMFANKRNLNMQDKIGMLNFRSQVEASTNQIISAYYNIVLQQQQVRVYKESMKISTLKLDIAKSKFDVGAGTRLDYLQSKVDLNTDSASLINQLALVKKAKKQLNYLIGEKDTSDYNVADTIILAPTLLLNGLQSLALQQNQTILSADARRQAYDAQIDIAKSGLYPTVVLSSRYNYGNDVVQAGPTLVNQYNGLNYFGTVRWNLIEGGTVRTAIKNAKVNEDIADIIYQDTVESINKQIGIRYEDYASNLNLVNLLKDNMKFATENLDMATESYRLGKVTLIDYRTAQLTYVNSVSSLVNAIYASKNSELSLMYLTGQISKEAQ